MRRIAFLHRFFQHAQGSVLVEFAIVAPILVLMLVGTIEISRYMLFREKLESTASQMLDIITQSTNVNAASLENLFSATPVMMEPYLPEQVHHIVTQIVRPAGDCLPVATWQFRNTGSRIAQAGSTNIKLGEIQLSPGDNVMAIEIFSFYEPLIIESDWVKEWFSKSATGSGGASGFTVYVFAYGHTRYGSFNLDPVSGRSITPACIAP